MAEKKYVCLLSRDQPLPFFIGFQYSGIFHLSVTSFVICSVCHGPFQDQAVPTYSVFSQTFQKQEVHVLLFYSTIQEHLLTAITNDRIINVISISCTDCLGSCNVMRVGQLSYTCESEPPTEVDLFIYLYQCCSDNGCQCF